MPCYEPKLEHEEREREFFIAALCHCVALLTPKQLKTFPGLAAWKERHEKIDAGENLFTGYDAPEFMKQFIRAFPK